MYLRKKSPEVVVRDGDLGGGSEDEKATPHVAFPRLLFGHHKLDHQVEDLRIDKLQPDEDELENLGEEEESTETANHGSNHRQVALLTWTITEEVRLELTDLHVVQFTIHNLSICYY